jgi:acetyl-CoA acetyltransferase
LSLSGAVVVGAGESPYQRHPDRGVTTERLLADALVRALADSGLARDAVDGLAVCSFTLRPDTAIDLAWQLGLRLRWLMHDATGGASGVNMLQHAVRAVEAGDASVVAILAGDRLLPHEFEELVNSYNRATQAELAPLPYGGPNTLFALVTQRHAERFGLAREDYAQVPLAQRAWAAGNPNAAYRGSMTLADYLAAPMVAPPLCRFDCVPVVSGANALIVAGEGRGVRIRAFCAAYNSDDQSAEGFPTGLAAASATLWEVAGLGPMDVDVSCVYDDYPVMVLVQLDDLGYVPGHDVQRFLHDVIGTRTLPVNTSGGQLSAGQAGAAGGLHGLVEAVRQLREAAGDRQVPGARTALVTGYGMVLYRYGACANAVVLESS